MNTQTASELAVVELQKEGTAFKTSNRKRTPSSNQNKSKGKRRLLHSQTEEPRIQHVASHPSGHNWDIMFNAGNVSVGVNVNALVAGEHRELDEEGFGGHQTSAFDQRPQLLLATGVHQLQLNCSGESSARSGRSPEAAQAKGTATSATSQVERYYEQKIQLASGHMHE